MATTPNPAITMTPAQIAEQVKAMNVQAMNSAANTAMSPQANKGGSVAQMQQQAQTPAETIAKAQAQPGVMQLGATTGATPGGQLPVTPTQFQAVTGAGATMDAASLKQMKETEARNEASRQAELNRLKQSSAAGTTSYYDAASGTWKQGSSPETQKIQAEMAATTPTWDAAAGTWKTGVATVGTAGATGAGADIYSSDPKMKLLAEQQKQIEDRLNYQQQYIQQQFDAKIRQEAARQKSESGQTAMVLSRMGAMGTTASGVSYLQSLDTQHAAQLSALESEKQSAIMQAQDASNAQLLDLAFKKVEQIDAIDKKYNDAAAARLADVQKYQVIAGKSFDDLAAAGKTLEDFPSGYFEHQDDVMRSYGADVPPGTSEAAFIAAKKAQEFKDAETEEKRKTAAVESAAKLIAVLDKIPKGKTIKIGDSEYEGIGDGNIKTGTETDSDGNVTFYQYDTASGTVKTTSLGTIGKSQDGWETKFDDNGKPWRMNAKTGQLVPFSPSNEQINIQSQLPDGSVWTRNGVPAVECGAFVNDLTGAGVGDTKESKIAKCDPTIKPGTSNPPQVGDFFVQTNGFGWTGHIGVVAGVDTDPATGKTVIRALESNYPKKGQITSSRPVDVSQIAGFGRTGANSDTLKQLIGGPDTSPTFGAGKTGSQELLSVSEATALGVPYGTTKSAAAAMGIKPKAQGRPLESGQANILAQGKNLTEGPLLNNLSSLIDQNTDLFGPIIGQATSRYPYGKGAKVQDDLARATQTIGSYMEGGVLRKEDEIKYRNMLPQLTDTVEVAKDKLEGVKKLLQEKQKSYLESYASSGFDTSRFDNAAGSETKNTAADINNLRSKYNY